MKLQTVSYRLAGLAWAALVLLLPLNAASQAPAKEGVDVGKNSAFSKLVPAEDVERSSQQQYLQLLQKADAQKALAGPDNAQLKRLRTIANRIIPFAVPWNDSARA